MTISLEEFIKYLLKKWKLIISIVIITTAVFATGAYRAGDEIYVPHSEEYLHNEREVEYLKNYLKESILMNLNPTCIYERTLYIEKISDVEMLRDYAKSQEIWNNLETERSKTYISELLRWNDIDSKKAEIDLKHATSEECLQCAEYIKEELNKVDSAIEIRIGNERIVVDENLQSEHLRWYDRIEYSEILLLNSQAGYTITVNKTAAAVVGALAGSIAAVVITLISYVCQEFKKRK